MFFLKIRKYFFTVRVAVHWHRFSREVVESSSVEYSKAVWTCLDRVIELDDLQKFLPTSAVLCLWDSVILGFCNTVILCLSAEVFYFILFLNRRDHETVLVLLAVMMLNSNSQYCIPGFLFALDILIVQIHIADVME